MSPDNWKSNPVVQRLMDTNDNLRKALPKMFTLLLADDGDFRGLTIFIGDTADYVLGVRRFGDDGTPEVIWSSGASVLEGLINLEKAIANGNFKVDKKAVKPVTKTTT